jgi:hypothetical protein
MHIKKADQMTSSLAAAPVERFVQCRRFPFGRLSLQQGGRDHLKQFLGTIGRALTPMLDGFSLMFGGVGFSIDKEGNGITLATKLIEQNKSFSRAFSSPHIGNDCREFPGSNLTEGLFSRLRQGKLEAHGLERLAFIKIIVGSIVDPENLIAPGLCFSTRLEGAASRTTSTIWRTQRPPQ